MINATPASYFLSLRSAEPPVSGPRSTAPGLRPGLVGLEPGERTLWRGRAAVAELWLDDAMDGSVSRWALPQTTEVVITDRRLAYAHAMRPLTGSAPRVWPPYQALSPTVVPVPGPLRLDGLAYGEVRWLWPEVLRVRPGNPPSDDRSGWDAGRTTAVDLVCTGASLFPTLTLSGGDLTSVGDADRLANRLRRAIVQFRLEHGAALGLSSQRLRALARRLLDPEFANVQGGPAQLADLPGALPLGVSVDDGELAATA